jgi:hypothetical protein
VTAKREPTWHQDRGPTLAPSPTVALLGATF